MRRSTLKQRLAATCCLLLLGLSLLLAGCGGYSSPSSPPYGTPQATPTKGGYSLISLLDNEIQLFLVSKSGRGFGHEMEGWRNTPPVGSSRNRQIQTASTRQPLSKGLHDP